MHILDFFQHAYIPEIMNNEVLKHLHAAVSSRLASRRQHVENLIKKAQIVKMIPFTGF